MNKAIEASPLFGCKESLLIIMGFLDNRDLLSLLTTCRYFLLVKENRDVYDHAMRVRLQYSNVFGIPFRRLLHEKDANTRQQLFDLSIDCTPQPFYNESLPELQNKLLRLLQAMELTTLRTFTEQPLQVLQPLLTEVNAFDETTVLSLRYADHLFKRADLNWHLVLVILLQMAELYTKEQVLAPEYDVVLQLAVKLFQWLASEKLEIEYLGHLRDLLDTFNYLQISRESLWSDTNIAELMPLHNMLLVNAPAKSDLHADSLRKLNQLASQMSLPMKNSLLDFEEIEWRCAQMCRLAPDANLNHVFSSSLAQYDIAWHALTSLAVLMMRLQATTTDIAIPNKAVSALAAMVAMAVHRGSPLDERGELGRLIFESLPLEQKILFTEKFSACLGINIDEASARYISDNFSKLVIKRIALLRTLFGKRIFTELQEVNVIPILQRDRILRRDGNLEDLPDYYDENTVYRLTDLIRFRQLANIQRMHRFMQWKMYFFFATAAAQFNLPLRAALNNCADLLVSQPVLEYLVSPERVVADCFIALGMTLPEELQRLPRRGRRLFFAAPAAPAMLGIPPQQVAINHDVFSDDEEVMVGASSADEESWDVDPQLQVYFDDDSSDAELGGGAEQNDDDPNDDDPNDDDMFDTPLASPSRKRGNTDGDLPKAKIKTLASSDDEDSAAPKSSSTSTTSSAGTDTNSDDVDAVEPTENNDLEDSSGYHTP